MHEVADQIASTANTKKPCAGKAAKAPIVHKHQSKNYIGKADAMKKQA